jgi:predicted component of type VI protein secretion system
MAKLVVFSEGLTGRSCDLNADRITVGRADDNAFAIPEASVSSHHCELLKRGNEFFIKDLDSTNGTFINDEPVKEAALKPGQILRLGTVEMRVEDPTAAAAPAKKPASLTQAVPQGVKLNDFEQGSRKVALDGTTAFKKKSNKVNQIFVAVGIVLAVLVTALLLFSWWR